jgi:hypothetical protein
VIFRRARQGSHRGIFKGSIKHVTIRNALPRFAKASDAGGSLFYEIARHLFGEITLWLGKTTKPSVWAEIVS